MREKCRNLEKKMAPCSPAGDRDAVRSCRGAKSKSRRPNYRRQVKPPYSYAELITMAIKESPTGRLTLKQIQDHMAANYECFRGSYVGWKNSVRHNLSTCACFVKVLRDTKRPRGKDNYWTLDPDCPHCEQLKKRPYPQSNSGAVLSVSTSCSPQRSSRPSARTSRSSMGQTSAATPPQKGNLSTTPSTTIKTEDGGSHAGLTSVKLTPSPSTAHDSHTEGPVSHSWPSSQPLPIGPSSEPYTGLGSVSKPPNDEWDLLSDLYVPDSDIDLSLYNDGDWACTDDRQCPQTAAEQIHQGYHPVSGESFIELKARSSRPGGSGVFPPPNALPRLEIPSLDVPIVYPAKMRIKVEHKASSRYHPYGGQMPHFHRHREYHVGFSGRECYQSAATRRTDDSRNVPYFPGAGSLVASAIRSSLGLYESGLNLDEMALCAIDNSVRVLDLTRPCDLVSA